MIAIVALHLVTKPRDRREAVPLAVIFG